MFEITPLDEFTEKLRKSIKKDQFVKLTLSKRVATKQELKNIYARIVEIKGEKKLNITYRFKNKDTHENLNSEDGINLIKKVLGENFLNGDLFTTQEDIHIKFSKKKKAKLLSSKPTRENPVSTAHNREKKRMIIADKKNPYLRSLGVIDQRGKVIKNMQDKFKQINKFIEIVDSLVKSADLPEETKITDMGSGKGYLTFAVYDYFTNQLNQKVDVKGVETRENLVKSCNNIAEKANYHNLKFLQANISDFQLEKVNILIALHACDTATDDAIYKGIQSGASIIIVSPCCHKQIRKQLDIKNSLSSIMKYGILLERQSEIITDCIRALLLESQGYQTKVFEFISHEHTSKNIMIAGIKSKNTVKEKALEEIEQIKKEFGIDYHYLEKLLDESAQDDQSWRNENPVCENE